MPHRLNYIYILYVPKTSEKPKTPTRNRRSSRARSLLCASRQPIIYYYIGVFGCGCETQFYGASSPCVVRRSKFIRWWIARTFAAHSQLEYIHHGGGIRFVLGRKGALGLISPLFCIIVVSYIWCVFCPILIQH